MINKGFLILCAPSITQFLDFGWPTQRKTYKGNTYLDSSVGHEILFRPASGRQFWISASVVKSESELCICTPKQESRGRAGWRMDNDLTSDAPTRDCNLFLMGEVRGRWGKEKYFKMILCLKRNWEIGTNNRPLPSIGRVSLFPSPPLSKIRNTLISHPRSDLELISSFQPDFKKSSINKFCY